MMSSHNPMRKKRFRNQDRTGAAAIEFALVVPLFLLVITGIVEFGQAFRTQHVLSTASCLREIYANNLHSFRQKWSPTVTRRNWGRGLDTDRALDLGVARDFASGQFQQILTEGKAHRDNSVAHFDRFWHQGQWL